MRRTRRLVMLMAVIPMALALVSSTAEAQRRHGGVRSGRPGGGVVVRGYFGYPYGSPFWDPFWAGPSRYGYPFYGYWGAEYDDSAEVRLEVKPKEAQVYVDGYYAGIVDDFDGVFQRLHVWPGEHELVLYLKGYRTVKQSVRLGVSEGSRIRYTLEPLAAGESNEPPPQPRAVQVEAAQPPQQQPDSNAFGRPVPRRPGQPGPRRPGPPDAPRQPAEPGRPTPLAPDESAVEQGQGFGSLVVRVQPSGADVLIDGERWQGPEDAERLVVQVSEGTHKIEVRKEGYVPFSTTVRVRRGETAPINVSLPPRGE